MFFGHWKVYTERDDDDNDEYKLVPPDDSSLVPNSNVSFVSRLTQRITIPGFLRIKAKENVNLSSSEAATISDPLLLLRSRASLVAGLTPTILNFLHSRSIISESSTAAGVPGFFSGIRQRISGSRTRTETPMSFHEQQKKILIESGLPSPPLGKWYKLDSPSLAHLKDLASERDNCTKAVEEMDADSLSSLGKFSTFMLAHLGVLVFMEVKIETCEHLMYLGFLLLCAVAFEALLGYMAVCQTGNVRWKYIRVKEDVAGLKQLMEEQMRQMEIPDVRDHHLNQLAANNAAGFQVMLTSCNRIVKPLEFCKTFIYQMLTVLLTISVIGITVNAGYNGWKSVC